MNRTHLEKVHKFAYRMILIITIIIDHVQPEWVKLGLKLAPYTLLAFDFYLYNSLVALKRVYKWLVFKLLIVLVALSVTLISTQQLPHSDSSLKHITFFREDRKIGIRCTFIKPLSFKRVNDRTVTSNIDVSGEFNYGSSPTVCSKTRVGLTCS